MKIERIAEAIICLALFESGRFTPVLLCIVNHRVILPVFYFHEIKLKPSRKFMTLQKRNFELPFTKNKESYCSHSVVCMHIPNTLCLSF